MAALVCSEVLSNNKDSSRDTFVATVDVHKAFDSVWHDSLLRNLHISTDGDSTWPLFAYLMNNMTVSIRLGSRKSRPVYLEQGVGQGRIPSTSLCKLHLNRLLSKMQASSIGSHIGHFYCGSPTCADDVFLLADTASDLQAQLNIIIQYSREERYNVNPIKTIVSVYPGRRSYIPDTSHVWNLCDEEVTPTDDYPHLGIIRSAGKLTPDVLISERLQLARRTRYHPLN